MKKKLIAVVIGVSLFYEMGITTNALESSTTGYSYSEQSNTEKDIVRKKGLIRYLFDGGYNNLTEGVKSFFQQAFGEETQLNNITNDNLQLDIGNSIKEDESNKETVDNSKDNIEVPQVTETEENKQSLQEQSQTTEPTLIEPAPETTPTPEQTAPSEQQVTPAPTTPVQDQTTKAPTEPSNSSQTPNTTTTPEQTPAATKTTNDKFMAQVEQAIFKKVNQERAKAGVKSLSYNKTMEKYARIKSQDMGDRKYFSHQDPQGKLITAKMQKDGVKYSAWGENIAYIGGISDPNALANQFMKNWMNSSGHRANILSNKFSGIGVGVYKIGNKVYATQEFIR
ncbi:CAP domain-containing protein [Clostridium sp. SHJSY1]|uniref:CAP domain-containing protein n=1 Tax=Clostridium sp. SHJSY1 TaxID=2942483 RepID=UPI0028759FA1|nr:CAP domain-containing protein [Clostridium sp. SHJSY1]MDS0526428.1 CAP domain-containing protein [Clostridium sp. SHJSY1]